MSIIQSINDVAMHVVWSVFGYDLSVLELVAVTTSLIGVWFGTTGTSWVWPWWAISSALYGWLFYNWQLYASAMLQLVFIAAAIWGWFGWGPQGAKPRKGETRQYMLVGSIGVLIWLLIAPLLAKVGAAATWPDSFGLVFSVVAQIIMVYQFRESWIIWFIVDAVYTIEYFTQKLWFTAILYALLTAIALRGWMTWGRMRVATNPVQAENLL